MNYILEEKKPVPVKDIVEWARKFYCQNRHVAKTKNGDVTVSTVFLGIDHSFDGGEPLLFETMIFGGNQDGYLERYPTWEDAEKGHDIACGIAGIK